VVCIGLWINTHETTQQCTCGSTKCHGLCCLITSTPVVTLSKALPTGISGLDGHQQTLKSKYGRACDAGQRSCEQSAAPSNSLLL
jgi:hypothetical protein